MVFPLEDVHHKKEHQLRLLWWLRLLCDNAMSSWVSSEKNKVEEIDWFIMAQDAENRIVTKQGSVAGAC